MLGIEDPWVVAPYILCILSALLCVVWGAIKWNKDDDVQEPEEEIKSWAQEDGRVEEEF